MIESPTETMLRTALNERSATTVAAPPSLADLYALADTTPATDSRRPSRKRSPVLRRSLTAAAVAAAIVGGAVWIIPGHDGPSTSSTSAGLPSAQNTSDAHRLLNQIALAAANSQLTAPRADQYIYVKIESTEAKVLNAGPDSPVQITGTTTYQEWTPQDPTKDGLVRPADGSEYQVVGVPATSIYANLTELPTNEPTALLAAIAAASKEPTPGVTKTALPFANVIGTGLLAEPLPPSLAAAVYRALATQPGILVEQNVTDLAGRKGVAIGATDPTGLRYELIFDPNTLEPLGDRILLATSGPRGKSGQLISATAYLSSGITDQPGQPPAN
jgi:hypothetical protein